MSRPREPHPEPASQLALQPATPERWGLAGSFTEVVERRQRGMKVFRHRDGRTYAAVFAGQLHYRRRDEASGSELWDDIDLSLTDAGDGTHIVERTECPVRVTGRWIEVTNRQGRGIRFEPSAPLAVDRTAGVARFAAWGVSWEYRPVPTGLKLTARVERPVGTRELHFAYAVVGGGDLVPTDDGGLSGEGFVIQPPLALGADGGIYRVGTWRLAGNAGDADAVRQAGSAVRGQLTLQYDDRPIPERAYPLLVDPTVTFPIGAGADDGYVYVFAGSYPPSGTPTVQSTSIVAGTQRSYIVGSGYNVGVGLCRWNTSSLGTNVIVQSATARLYLYSVLNTDNRNLMIEWYQWAPPISTSHWTNMPSSTAGSLSLSGIPTGQYYDVPLSNAETGVNRTGYTGLRFHISDGATPSGSNAFWFYAYEQGTAYYPQLVVTYVQAQVSLSAEGVQGRTTTGDARLSVMVTLFAEDAQGRTATGDAPLALVEVVSLSAEGVGGRTTTGEVRLGLAPRYLLLVDWQSDGFEHPLSDVTGDTLEVTAVSGREQPYEFLGQARIGELTARLRNSAGQYSVFRSSSPLAGLARPGKLVQLRMLADGQYVPIWTGYLDRIVPEGGMPPTVTLRAMGPFSVLVARPVWTAALHDVGTHEAVTALLDAAGWPEDLRRVGTGATTLARFFARGEDALTELHRVEQAELGLLREGADGSVVFEPRTHRTTGERLVVQCVLDSSPLAPDGALSYQHLELLDPIDGVVNEATWTVQGYTVQPEGEVFRLQAVPFVLVPGEERVLVAEYRGSGDSYVVQWRQPTVGTADADIIVSAATVTATLQDECATRVTLSLKNTGMNPVTVGQVVLRGVAAEAASATGAMAQDTTSQILYGRRSIQVQTTLLSDPNVGRDFALATVNRYAFPIPVVKVEFAADTSPRHHGQAAVRQVSDRVLIRERDVLGIDFEGFIERIEHRITPGTHKVTWVIAPAFGEAAWVLGTSALGIDTKLGF